MIRLIFQLDVMDLQVPFNCSNNELGCCIGPFSSFSMDWHVVKSFWSSFSFITLTILMLFKLWHHGFFGKFPEILLEIKNYNYCRYLTAAVVLSINSRKRKSIERDLVKVIEQEEYAYKDPVTEFILWWVMRTHYLWNNFNLASTWNLISRKLKKCLKSAQPFSKMISSSKTTLNNLLKMLDKLFSKHFAEFINVSGKITPFILDGGT